MPSLLFLYEPLSTHYLFLPALCLSGFRYCAFTCTGLESTNFQLAQGHGLLTFYFFTLEFSHAVTQHVPLQPLLPRADDCTDSSILNIRVLFFSVERTNW